MKGNDYLLFMIIAMGIFSVKLSLELSEIREKVYKIEDKYIQCMTRL